MEAKGPVQPEPINILNRKALWLAAVQHGCGRTHAQLPRPPRLPTLRPEIRRQFPNRETKRMNWKWLAEFREFALKGNVVDLAVSVIIGAALCKILSALV